MHISKEFSHYKTLMILCLLATSTCGCNFLPVRASQFRGAQESKEHFSGKGLRITEFLDGSPAEQAGLRRMDIIFRYGDFEIVDDASFFAAREAYENGRQPEIPIVVWRDGKAMRMTVGPGRLGIMSNEYSPVAYQFSSLMMRLDGQREIPEYQRVREFKDGYIPEEKILDEARDLINKAERESTLTPAQILVARIYMTPDDASPEDLKRQSELLAQLISTQPASYIIMLGQDRFFEKKHHRAAVECFKRHLEVHPDDVSMRLNMGLAYYQLRMFAEAEAAADYVLDHQLGLSSHGYEVAYNVKAMGLLSRGDYSKSIFFAEKAFDIEHCHCDISLVLLAAAQTGDLQKLAEASAKFQKALPEEFEKRKLQLTAVEAYALVKSNQRPRARLLAQQWKDTDRVEGRLKAYWKIYPGGSDVWNNWNELTRN
jgi:tetratricopeptide (TPR) repeat protein